MTAIVSSRMVQTATFRAMATPITLTAVGCDRARFTADLQEIEKLAEEWEARFSRFRPESGLSQLNAGAGHGAQTVEAPLFDLIERALEVSHQTRGLFNPLVLPAMLRNGYDRTFRDVQARGSWRVDPGTPVPDPDQVRIDSIERTIDLPSGVQIDLGGIAKGAFVDVAFERLAGRWDGGCINAGGDLRLWGLPPDGDCWRTGIEDPLRPDRDLAIAKILNPATSGSIATSGRNRRRWRTSNGIAHHLIDPATGEPSQGGIETATAFAADATSADIAAKVLYLSAARNGAGELFGAALGITIDCRGYGSRWEGEHAHDLEIIPIVVWTGEPA
jgi:FAD:protein FMN transferase